MSVKEGVGVYEAHEIQGGARQCVGLVQLTKPFKFARQSAFQFSELNTFEGGARQSVGLVQLTKFFDGWRSLEGLCT